MLTHGTKQSFLMVIDSSMRDTNAYPTPSEYHIPFPQPFKNVVGVSIVDASIPRTEYSVERGHNVLAYAPGLYTSYAHALSSNTLVEVAIPPGDYNTATLAQSLNAALKTTALSKNHSPLQVLPVSVPVELTNRVSLTRSEPFTVFMGSSSIRYILGFGTPATALGTNVNWDGTSRFTTDTNLANDTFVSVPTTKQRALTYVGPVPIETTEYAISASAGIRQTFTAETSGLLYSVKVRGVGQEGTILTGLILDVDQDATVQKFTCTIDETTEWTAVLDSQTAKLEILKTEYSGGHVKFTTVEDHGLEQGDIVTVDGATTWNLNGQWVIIEATSTTLRILADIPSVRLGSGTVSASKELVEGKSYVIVIDANPDVSVYRALAFRDVVGSLIGGETTYPEDALSVDVMVTQVGYGVDAPGQVNLTGERYVVIRSPEIEQHTHRDLVAFDRMTPGLGLVKLGGNSGGYRDERMNFSSFTPPEFHPIGKMHGLSIRLETGRGTVYNAHGIDHTLMVSVTMMTSGTPSTIPRTLYPGYEPNAQKMVQSITERERDSTCQPYS